MPPVPERNSTWDCCNRWCPAKISSMIEADNPQGAHVHQADVEHDLVAGIGQTMFVTQISPE